MLPSCRQKKRDRVIYPDSVITPLAIKNCLTKQISLVRVVRVLEQLSDKLKVFLIIFSLKTFFQITTKIHQLKSNLLLKIECGETHIYMKTDCLQTKCMHHHLGGGK